jgi:alpha-aminoadipate carrier protein LysW
MLKKKRLTIAIYNTRKGCRLLTGGETVARCPDCEAEIELEEDEVEEGEILSCPECDVELEVVQIHPVKLNAVSEDEEEEDEGLYDEDDMNEAEEEEEEEDED